jgi:hypothetical protein
MKWTGSIKAVQGIKAVQVEIKEDLHAAAKARASLLGIRVADLYADAIDRVVSAEDPCQGFTMDQLRYLREFLRNPQRKGDKFLGEVLQTILDGEYA